MHSVCEPRRFDHCLGSSLCAKADPLCCDLPRHLRAGESHLGDRTATPLYDLVERNGTRDCGRCNPLHGGDALISTAALLVGGILARLRGWHLFGTRMLATVIALGIGYTILSEWLNVGIWRTWSYSSAMPVLPWLGTGLSPVLVVPGIALSITFRWGRS